MSTCKWAYLSLKQSPRFLGCLPQHQHTAPAQRIFKSLPNARIALPQPRIATLPSRGHPLLSNMGGPQSLFSTSQSLQITSKKYWKAESRANKLIIAQLILLTITTGMQDAITYIDYHCLHSAQTGNTVLLSVATSYNTANYRPLVANAASSIIAFNIGSFLTGQSGALLGHRTRAWQFGLGMLQTCMDIGAVTLIGVHGVQDRALWT